jgi:hypothetical protein
MILQNSAEQQAFSQYQNPTDHIIEQQQSNSNQENVIEMPSFGEY